jgi:hypothetical protein
MQNEAKLAYHARLVMGDGLHSIDLRPSRAERLRLSPHLLAFAPERGRNGKRIDFAGMPPPPFVTGGVILTMVDGAERYGEFIAHLEG